MATDIFGNWIDPDKAARGPKLSKSTFDSAAGAVSDLFAAEGYRFKARGARLEGENYDSAAKLADQNAQFTEMSTAIKTAQQERSLGQQLGGQRSDIANAGFAESGSALDLMRDSASQGALTKAVIGYQGLITEAGYKQQAASYRTMSAAAALAADADENAATGAEITAGIKGAAALASLFL